VSKLGIFVNRQTLSSSEQLTALVKCRDVAESMGHTVEFIFPVDIKKIPKLDALFIRANTDPMNTTYVAAKIASLYGVPVIDDPNSIKVCADKVNMYLHLMKKRISLPRTRFLSKKEVNAEYIKDLFEELGAPLVLKEPSTSFSVRVEKASTVSEFLKVARRYLKLSDWIVVQEYIESRFDWRIGVLNGEMLYACRYIIPSETFKIQASVNGHIVYCDVESVPAEQVPSEVVDLGIEAGRAVGNGLYGVDIKESNGRLYVIEINDNPSLEGGEDAHYPDMFRRIISYLTTGCTLENPDMLEPYGPYGFEGEYGLRAMPAFAQDVAMVENDVYSYKIDFCEKQT
jgi:glutathione synthase/RimK-type ligase-like ATP-grasp enzyme